MQINLSFPIFNPNQIFSPIAGEHKNTNERLKYLSLQIQSQLKKYRLFPSKFLPAKITITFIINKDNFDTPALLLLSHKILTTLRLNMILQDTNNHCVQSITIKHKFTPKLDNEGCIIELTD